MGQDYQPLKLTERHVRLTSQYLRDLELYVLAKSPLVLLPCGLLIPRSLIRVTTWHHHRLRDRQPTVLRPLKT